MTAKSKARGLGAPRMLPSGRQTYATFPFMLIRLGFVCYVVAKGPEDLLLWRYTSPQVGIQMMPWRRYMTCCHLCLIIVFVMMQSSS